MGSSQDYPVKAAIWLTAHSRMAAEKRYRTYDVTSSILLSWLSLSVTVWAVVRGSVQPNPMLDTYAAVVATLVFAFSIITAGFRFGETAAAFRECYLRLMKIYESNASEEELTNEYQQILESCSNHGQKDYEFLVLSRTFFENRTLWDRHHKPIIYTRWMIIKWVLRSGGFWLLTAGLALLGAVPYFVIFHSK